MKLKNLVGAIAGLTFSVLLSATVFAAPTAKVGAPVDATTGNAVDTLTANQVVAVPVDLYTDNTSDVIANFNLTFFYDSDVLTPTRVSSFSAFGGNAAANNGTLKGTYAINTMVTNDEWEDAIGNYIYNKMDDQKIVSIVATNVKDKLTSSKNGNRVAYFFFKVNKEAPLNAELVKLNTGAQCYIKIGDADDVTLVTEYAKTNACAAAFKLVIDPADMDYYIHSLKITVNDVEKGKIDEYVVNGSKYEFPVRLIGTADSVKVTVVAETGTETEVKGTKTLIDNVSLALNPTSYAEY